MNDNADSSKPDEEQAPPAAEKIADPDKEEKSMAEKAKEKAILVPVDFSPASEAALAYAGNLADRLGAPLVVLHVVHDPEEMPGYYMKAMKKKRLGRIEDIAAEMLDDFLLKAKKEHSKTKSLGDAEPKLLLGVPTSRIMQFVAKIEPRMVVMGSKGRTGLKHVLLGSIAEHVAQLCPVPVTIVKAKK